MRTRIALFFRGFRNQKNASGIFLISGGMEAGGVPQRGARDPEDGFHLSAHMPLFRLIRLSGAYTTSETYKVSDLILLLL